MAGFKTHTAVGAATGWGLSVFTYMIGWTSNLYMSIIIFFATIIGSFLPDMDSNSGLPVQIIFGIYSYFAATLSLYFLYENGANIYLMVFTPIASFTFVKYVFEPFFKKYTAHRGIFHSFPAFIIAFLATLFVANYLKLNILDKFAIALSIGLGYFSHLLLDEIYSVNFLLGKSKKRKKESIKDFIKRRFGFKRSFGTALDLGFNQKDKYPAIIAYIILVVLLYICFPLLKGIYKAL